MVKYINTNMGRVIMKIRSRSIFIIVSILTILLIVQIIMYNNFFNDLKKDIKIINDLSSIRGSIQRFTKLEISNNDNLALRMHIDSLINSYAIGNEQVYLKSIKEYYNIKVLHKQWETLLSFIDDYKKNPTDAKLMNVIAKSEHCWETANSFVLRNQYIANKTTSYFKYFTITLGLNLLAIVLFLILYKKYVYNNLADCAIRDPLTGVFNRRYFDEYLNHEILRAKRSQKIFCLIMFDIDHFKHVNDTYGHDMGDYALITLSEIIQNSIRKSDVLSRIGGEEFMVLLPDTDVNNAFHLAERIRLNTESFEFNQIGNINLSIGITEFRIDDSNDSIVKRVDTALYLAKSNGRNRCEII